MTSGSRTWVQVSPVDLLPGDTVRIEYDGSTIIARVVNLEVNLDDVAFLQLEGFEEREELPAAVEDVFRLTWQPGPAPAGFTIVNNQPARSRYSSY